MRTLVACLVLVTAACGDSGTVAATDTGSTAAPQTTTGDTSSGAPTTGAPAPDSSTSSTSSTSNATDAGSTSTTDALATTTDAHSTTDASTTTADPGTTSTTADDPSTADPSTADPSAADPVIPGPKIKVMTFNIRVGTANDGADSWDNRKQLVYTVFENQDADFIGVQEALKFQVVAIDNNVDGYKRIGRATVDGDDKGPFNAIYYRKSRFSLDDSDTFWLSDTPGQPGSKSWGNDHPRAVTWGHFVEKSSGYSFYVYNTHFDHQSQNSREKSAVLLAKRIDNRKSPQDPFVVTGDFNAGEGNNATKYLKGNVKIGGDQNPVPMRDTFRVHSPDATNVGTAHGFNGGTGGNKIDYVYVVPQQEVVNAYISHFNVNGRYPSDHFPVIGVVRFADKD